MGKIQGKRRRDGRGWAGWMASLTQWTWVCASSGRWWRTGKPRILQSMGSQRFRHDWATEQLVGPGINPLQIPRDYCSVLDTFNIQAKVTNFISENKSENETYLQLIRYVHISVFNNWNNKYMTVIFVLLDCNYTIFYKKACLRQKTL